MKTKHVGQKWKLKSGLLYAGLNGLQAALVGPDQASVFDSLDNQTLKSKFYSAVLGVPFEVELCVS